MRNYLLFFLCAQALHLRPRVPRAGGVVPRPRAVPDLRGHLVRHLHGLQPPAPARRHGLCLLLVTAHKVRHHLARERRLHLASGPRDHVPGGIEHPGVDVPASARLIECSDIGAGPWWQVLFADVPARSDVERGRGHGVPPCPGRLAHDLRRLGGWNRARSKLSADDNALTARV